MNQILYQDLQAVLNETQIKVEEPMKGHTTFKIGGPADFLVIPESAEQISALFRIFKRINVPYFIMGNGSNLLVSDEGYRGVIVKLGKNFSHIMVEGEIITAEAGISLAQLAKEAADHELTGLEFAGGIPGTLGGAVNMNAGAYGGEMKDILTEVMAVNAEGEWITLSKEELKLGYRTSILEQKDYTALKAVMKLQKGESAAIRSRMEELQVARRTKQPLEYPSAGSTFKRPEGYFAGKLIQDAGLRGYQVGGAQIAEKHCGFVINCNEATAADVRQLIADVQRQIREQFQVSLETEVKMLGEFKPVISPQ